jgi:Zn-finger nucleic acid-binding protein
MQCPVCVDVQLSISSREGVEIDYCPQCRGVWLDRGELDKILDRVAAAPAAPPPPPARDDRPRDDRDRDRDRDRDDRHRDRDDRYRDRDDRSSKKRRRGSFLEDLFDFD